MSEDPTPAPPVRLDYRNASAVDLSKRGQLLSVLLQMAVVLGLLCLLVVIILPMLGRAGPAGHRIKCASNLRQIAMACIMYAGTTGRGQFPDSAGTALAETDLTAEPLTCPETNDVPAPGPTTQQYRQQINASRPPGTGGCCSYVYVGAGQTSGSPLDTLTVLAYEPATNHQGAGGNVVYADAHVEWYPAATLNQIIAAVQAGQNPPPAAATQPSRKQ